MPIPIAFLPRGSMAIRRHPTDIGAGVPLQLRCNHLCGGDCIAGHRDESGLEHGAYRTAALW